MNYKEQKASKLNVIDKQIYEIMYGVAKETDCQGCDDSIEYILEHIDLIRNLIHSEAKRIAEEIVREDRKNLYELLQSPLINIEKIADQFSTVLHVPLILEEIKRIDKILTDTPIIIKDDKG